MEEMENLKSQAGSVSVNQETTSGRTPVLRWRITVTSKPAYV